MSWVLRNSRALGWENIQKHPHNVAAWNLRMGYQRLTYSHQSSIGKNLMTHMAWRTYSIPVSLEESSALSSEDYSSNDYATKSPKEVLAQPLSSDEVKFCDFMCADTEGISPHFNHLYYHFLFLMGNATNLFLSLVSLPFSFLANKK